MILTALYYWDVILVAVLYSNPHVPSLVLLNFLLLISIFIIFLFLLTAKYCTIYKSIERACSRYFYSQIINSKEKIQTESGNMSSISSFS